MPTCERCNDTHRMPHTGNMCTACPTPCRACARDDGRGAYCQDTPCGCKCHGLTKPDAFDRLDRAARDRGRAAGSGAPYSRDIRDMFHTATELRKAALAYAAEHLAEHYRDARIPRGHVGDEPSAFDAIEHLRTKADQP